MIAALSLLRVATHHEPRDGVAERLPLLAVEEDQRSFWREAARAHLAPEVTRNAVALLDGPPPMVAGDAAGVVR